MKTKILILPLLVLFFCKIAFAGGFIVVSPAGTNGWVEPGFNPYMLENKSLKVSVTIEGLIATTVVDQIFYNPGNTNLQGWFFFPVPKGAVLKNFSMEINGKKTEAELLDSDKARTIYEDIVRKMRDPALLEYSEQNLFKVRIFPIEARSEKHITITYSEILVKENNLLEYIFPLNTEKYTAKPLSNVSFDIQAKETSKITTVYSPSHKVEIIRNSENSVRIGYEEKTVKPDQDFKLYIGISETTFGVSLINSKSPSEEGFFLLDITPSFVKNEEQIIDKDITFVLDVSGSMAGDKMDQAKKALLFCIENLNKGDNFEIIKFSTQASALFGKRFSVNSENLQKAKDFINSLKPIGGTNMQEAFELACAEKAVAGRPNFIVFITDGKPTVGETQDDKLLGLISSTNSENTRVFTFGVGEDINTHLLDKITETTKAYRTYIASNEDMELKISDFYTKISSPILTNPKISISGNVKTTEIYPSGLDDFFKGSSQIVLGRYDKNGDATVSLEGTINGKPQRFTYKVEFKDADQNQFVPVLWATRKIGFLLDQIRLNGAQKELVDEVTQLAKKYGVITPYTSYLILEDEVVTTNPVNNPPIFRGRFGAGGVDDFSDKSKKEYENMNEISGSGSIQTSSEFQSLSNARSISDVKQGSSRMFYTEVNGQDQNFATQVRNIQGRAVYQSGTNWIDVYSEKNTSKVVNLKFAEKDYFDLLSKYPQVSQFYALGTNVRFVFNNQLYQVVE
jgi:Ca-activated chloride channel family protein